MNAVKTYNHLNRENDSLRFGISRMEEIHHRHKGVPDEPHRHNYYTVVLAKKAKGEHKIDFNSYLSANQQLFFISPRQVYQITEEERSEGF